MPILDQLGEWTGLPRGVLWVMGGIFLGLVLGTAARLAHLHKLSHDNARSLLLRLRTWWIIAAILALVIVLGRPATVTLLCVVSLLALREYFALLPERARFGRVLWWVYAAAVLQYVWVYLGDFDLSMIFVPVLVFLLLTLLLVLQRRPDGFIHMVGEMQWGLMMLVFGLSHVALLLARGPEDNPVGGAVGWFLYLVILTEFNDIAQALWGRPFGKHKIIPEVSPGKSWEGLIGATACTTVLAVLLAPLLTPLGEAPPRLVGDPGGWWASLPFYLSPWSIAVGLGVGVAGFCGDIVISAVKRDAHVKDSGSLLPGQGGILDRIDSLTFTAPLFFHYTRFLYDL